MLHIQSLLERQREEKRLVRICPAFLGRIEMDSLISAVDKIVLEDAAGGAIAEQ